MRGELRMSIVNFSHSYLLRRASCSSACNMDVFNGPTICRYRFTLAPYSAVAFDDYEKRQPLGTWSCSKTKYGIICITYGCCTVVVVRRYTATICGLETVVRKKVKNEKSRRAKKKKPNTGRVPFARYGPTGKTAYKMMGGGEGE